MTPATQELVTDALDQALTAHVCQLYDVLMAADDDDGLARFWNGLNRTVGMHEELKATIEADDACTATASSGSLS
jgi:hypothetical protein